LLQEPVKMFISLLLLATIATSTVVSAHEKSFPTHPEWSDIWPDPMSLNDLKFHDANDHFSLPDLSGIWTGSPAGGITQRYFFTPSGGGYGSSKDSSFTNEPPLPPGTSYDVRCITGDWTAKMLSSCGGWKKARVSVAKTKTKTKTTKTISAAPWEATVTFFTNESSFSKTGTIEGNKRINMDLPWNHFVGGLTGLWSGQQPDDIYVLTHNSTTNKVTTWWDCSQTASVGWYSGVGAYDSATQGVNMNWTGYGSKNGFTNPPYFNEIENGTWGDYPSWTKRPQQQYPSDIHTVHMIFMNHLDIGYTTTIMDVLNEYVHTYFQKVEQLGNSMRALEGTDRFIYTTHPWLMSLLMECPCPPPSDGSMPNATCAARSLNNSLAPSLTCAGVAEIQAFKDAVAKGDIVWHAAPMNNQFENQSPLLVEAGLKLTRRYDRQFYGPHVKNNETITMSDRDVIYVTRSMIPYLAQYGVKGLTIGSNGANFPPQVPKLHVWKDESSGTDVIVVYHPYGYVRDGIDGCEFFLRLFKALEKFLSKNLLTFWVKVIMGGYTRLN
jgi:hypothetical protein